MAFRCEASSFSALTPSRAEADAGVLRLEVAALRTRERGPTRGQATRVTRTLERLTLALPGPAADPPRGRWPWQS